MDFLPRFSSERTERAVDPALPANNPAEGQTKHNHPSHSKTDNLAKQWELQAVLLETQSMTNSGSVQRMGMMDKFNLDGQEAGSKMKGYLA